MAHKTDEQITQDVLAELAWDPAVKVNDLSISTKQGRVTLKGTADTYGTKLDAEDVAYRVGGVRSVENETVVNPPAPEVRADPDIAADIRSVLALDSQVPDDRISVSVVNGYITLTGNVDWYYQKNAAEKDTARIRGCMVLTTRSPSTSQEPRQPRSRLVSRKPFSAMLDSTTTTSRSQPRAAM